MKKVFFSVLCIFASNALADGSVLRGLGKTCSIKVAPLDQEARSAGLTAKGLQSAVAKRLRRAGFVVMSGGPAQMYVRVVNLTSKSTSGELLGFAAHIELSLREKAFLARKKGTFFMGQTWFKGAVVAANKNQFVRQVVKDLLGLTDQFVFDYKRANGV